MNSLAKITASYQVCDDLVKAGIEPRAFFWHVLEEGKWDVWEVENPTYKPGEIIPAWTKEELEIMIGGGIPKPDLLPQDRVPVLTNDQKEIYFDYEYVVFDINKLRGWKPTKMFVNPGARAAADILLGALKNNLTTVKLANDRYKYFFL